MNFSRLALLLSGILLASSTQAAPGSFEAGVTAYEAGKLDEAQSLFQSIDDQSEQAVPAALYLGRIALRQSHYDDAAKILEKAVKKVPDNAEYVSLLGEAECAQAQTAGMFSAFGYAKSCVKHFERAVELAPDNIDYRGALFSYYLQAPGIVGGGSDKARAQADEIAKRDPAMALAWKAQIEAKDEHYDAAEKLLKTAIDTAKENTDYRFQLGMLYQTAKRYDDAFTTFSALHKEKPDQLQALYQIGRTAVISKTRLDEGADALKTYLGSPEDPKLPSHAWAHYRLGLVYDLQGKKDDSRQEYRLAAQSNPDKALKEALDKAS